MGILLDIRLREAAMRAGRWLRGFDDPSLHTGSRESFYDQFRRVLELPAIHLAKRGPISFAATIDLCRLNDRGPEPQPDPVYELAALLDGPLVNDAGEREIVNIHVVTEDLNRMLATPAMRFYFRTDDVASFADAVRRIAGQVPHPVCLDAEKIQELPVEQFRPMELGSALSCYISYKMLRLVTQHVPIVAYQAEDYVTAT
jgi:hypothetical protein